MRGPGESPEVLRSDTVSFRPRAETPGRNDLRVQGDPLHGTPLGLWNRPTHEGIKGTPETSVPFTLLVPEYLRTQTRTLDVSERVGVKGVEGSTGQYDEGSFNPTSLSQGTGVGSRHSGWVRCEEDNPGCRNGRNLVRQVGSKTGRGRGRRFDLPQRWSRVPVYFHRGPRPEPVFDYGLRRTPSPLRPGVAHDYQCL